MRAKIRHPGAARRQFIMDIAALNTSPDLDSLMTDIARYDVEIGDYTVSDLEPVNFGKTWRLIDEDDVFVEATLNPVGLTLIRSLLGQSAVLGNDTWLMRARDNKPRGMHTTAAHFTGRAPALKPACVSPTEGSGTAPI